MKFILAWQWRTRTTPQFIAADFITESSGTMYTALIFTHQIQVSVSWMCTMQTHSCEANTVSYVFIKPSIVAMPKYICIKMCYFTLKYFHWSLPLLGFSTVKPPFMSLTYPMILAAK